MGAGVIPLAQNAGEVFFLFQRTFSGRKVGHLIDFGGGLAAGENYRATAVREFVEESETLYFAEDLGQARRSTERIRQQISLVDDLFERTLQRFPHWWRRRDPGDPEKPKDWRTYFIEFPFRDVEPLNREWAADLSGRFKKRRELVWLSGHELLQLYASDPQRLWKRVRQLQQAEELIREIEAQLAPA